MKRYLSLYFQFFRNCLIRDFEFRFNVLIWTILHLFWLGLSLLSIELIFGQINSIAGWSKQQVFLLVVVQSIFRDLLYALALDNFNHFSRYIRKGDLDHVLLKPINSRFFVSTRYFESDRYFGIIISFLVMFKILSNLQIQPAMTDWLIFSFLIALGIFIFYNLFFLATTTTFWLTNIFNLDELFSNIISNGRFPVQIYQGSLKVLFTFIIPIAFVATFPVQALFGQVGFNWVIYGAIIAFVSFVFSQMFWKFALKHYSSASS